MISKQASRSRRTELIEDLGNELKENGCKLQICDRRMHIGEQTDKTYHMGRGMHIKNVRMLVSRLSRTPHTPNP